MQPASVTRISNLQARTGWKLLTDASIGPNPPAAFNLDQDLWYLPGCALLSVTGVPGKYCDALAAVAVPLPAGACNFVMDFSFALDADSLINAQAVEMDTKVTDADGVTYNGSCQWDYSQSATTMAFQVVNAKGGWVNTGLVLPKFTAVEDHRVEIEHALDAATNTWSVLSVVVDGAEAFEVPVALQNVPGVDVGWAPNEIVAQLQQDVNEKGGSWEWLIYELSYDCW